MILNFAGEHYPDTIVKLNENEIKNVESFRYLDVKSISNNMGLVKRKSTYESTQPLRNYIH